MTTYNLAYDDPQYLVHQQTSAGEAGGAATTQYSKFAAFTAMQVYAVQYTVSTAGTAAGGGFAALKISGTATTTMALTTLGTSVAGTTTNVLLSTSAGGVALLQGDILAVASLVDATGKVVPGYEISLVPFSNLTR